MLVIVHQRSAVRFGLEVLASLAVAATPIGFRSASLEVCSHCATSLVFGSRLLQCVLVQPEAATRIAVPLLVCLALRCLLPFLFPVYRWISDLPSVQRGWRRQPAGTGGCVYCLLSPRSDRSLLFDFAGAADAMSPLGVGRQWTVDETIVGRLVSSGCRLCLLALLFCLVRLLCVAVDPCAWCLQSCASRVSELRSNTLMFSFKKRSHLVVRTESSSMCGLFGLFCELSTFAQFRFNRFPIEFRVVVGKLRREKEPPNPFRVPECFYFTLWTHWILAVTFFSVSFIVQAVKEARFLMPLDWNEFVL